MEWEVQGSVMDPGEHEEERRGREGGKGRVLGQADRDVSTASVILWRPRERQSKKRKNREGIGAADLGLVTAEAETTPTTASGDAGRAGVEVEVGGVWGVKPEGGADLPLHTMADS